MAKRQKKATTSGTGGGAASSATGGSGEDVDVIQSKVNELQQTLTTLTHALGEGKTSEGKWVGSLGPRGIQARCALAALNARGKVPDPRHPSASGVAPRTCVHETKLGQCLVCEHLAYCYHCFQPLCPVHRILICESKIDSEGKRLGGASCACLDRTLCQDRATQQAQLLSEVGSTAQGGKGRRAEQQAEKGKGGASTSGTHPPKGGHHQGKGGYSHKCSYRGGWGGWQQGGWGGDWGGRS